MNKIKPTQDPFSILHSWLSDYDKVASEVSSAIDAADDGTKPLGSGGALAKEQERDMKAQTGPAAIDNAADGGDVTARSDQTDELKAKPVGDDPDNEKPKETSTPEKDTKEEQAKFANQSKIAKQLLESVSILIGNTPVPQSTSAAKPATKTAAELEQEAYLEKVAAAIEDQVEANLAKSGIDSITKLASFATQQAIEHANMFGSYLAGFYKAAEEAPGQMPTEQAMVDQAMAGATPGGAPAVPGGNPPAGGADPAAAGGQQLGEDQLAQLAQEIVSNLSPEEKDELIQLLQQDSAGGGAPGGDAGGAPAAPKAEPEPEGDEPAPKSEKKEKE